MLVRVCDRCGMTIATAAAALAVQLPKDAPASKPNKVTIDPFPVSLSLDLQPVPVNQAVVTPDLCPPCMASAVVAALMVILAGSGLSKKQAAYLEAQIDAAGGA